MEGIDTKQVGDQGITQRGVKELFTKIDQARKQDSSRHFSVFVSFLQIYSEKVFDLLNPNSTGPI
jgi:hypothetical protein